MLGLWIPQQILDLDLKALHTLILAYIYQDDNMSVTRLSRELKISLLTTVREVNKLIDNEYVKITIDEDKVTMRVNPLVTM